MTPLQAATEELAAERPPVVLVVGGSDPSGGAGVQADIKTITALGCYAAAAITAITVQNTLGVTAVVPVDPRLVRDQLQAVLSDLPVDAIKLGMLGSTETVQEVAQVLEERAASIPVILDPVLASSSGFPLLTSAGIEILCGRLLPLAALVTPNVPEARRLTGLAVESAEDFGAVCDTLVAAGAAAVLVKGGHLASERLTDYLRTADGLEHHFVAKRLESRATHGTGCTLASAIAAGAAEGRTLVDAIERAHGFVHQALRTAVPMGAGLGPLNHLFGVKGPQGRLSGLR